MNKKDIVKEVENIVSNIDSDLKREKTFGGKRKIRKNAHKRFDIIFEKYGQKAYCKYVPEKYRKQDIRELLKEKRFITILDKHGKNTFDRYYTKIMAEDIAYETGSSYRKFDFIAKRFISRGTLSSAAAISIVVPIAIIPVIDMGIEDEKEEYNMQITEYMQCLEEFGESTRMYNLSDIQNIMFITDDMWKNIEGYKSPELDLSSYPGLDIATKEGYGVCRNMADHAARELNAIDERYNARTINVYADGDGYEIANIERTTLEDDGNEETTSGDGGITKVFGNHAVVLCDSIEDEGLQLIFCPTNPSVGVFINGEIHMFNSNGDDPYEYKYRPLGTILHGSDRAKEIPENIINSIEICTKGEMEYYENKYGVNAQNKAIKEVEELNPKSFYEISSDKINLQKRNESVDNEFINRIRISEEDLQKNYNSVEYRDYIRDSDNER
ncbi:MAG: hypothetical protein IJH12_02325 [Clostridia bacterium]|nr:hypothetical protein [Clostridia bacterium]